MLLKKKEEPKPVQYSQSQPVYKTAPKIDWRIYEPSWDSVIPHGKYAGTNTTVEDIKNNDDWYWGWMNENNILSAWGLYRPKRKQSVKGVNCFFAETFGEYWVDLRAVEQTTTPADTSWYQ